MVLVRIFPSGRGNTYDCNATMLLSLRAPTPTPSLRRLRLHKDDGWVKAYKAVEAAMAPDAQLIVG